MSTDKSETQPEVTKQQRDDFELHVRLLQRNKGLKLAEARAAAWMTGPMGLEKTLKG